MSRSKPLSITSVSKAASKLAEELSDFESRHQAMLTTHAPSLSAEEIKRGMALHAQVPSLEHMKILQSLVPSQEVLEHDTKLYLERIRGKRIEQELSRQEREKRRRKVILEEQRKSEQVDRSSDEKALLQKVYRQSQEERRVAEQQEKEHMVSNRVFREHQYRERRQKDYEEALALEYELCEKQRREYKKQTALQLQQHFALLRKKEDLKLQKHTQTCADIVDQIVNMAVKIDLSEKIAEHKRLNDGVVLEPFQNEIKTLFFGGKHLDKIYDISAQNDRLELLHASDRESSVPEDIVEGVKLLDDQSFADYLYGQGSWSYPPNINPPLVLNEPLGKIITKILNIVHTPEKVELNVILPALPVKIALIGKKFSGKSSVAARMKDLYGINMLNIDDLVKAVTTLSFNPPITGELDITDPVQSHKYEIASQVQECLTRGQPLGDALLVQVAADALQYQMSNTATIATASADIDGKNEGFNLSQFGGWVLVDFPRTRAQAQLLERELTGYEEPKVIKPGNFKRMAQGKETKNIAAAGLTSVQSSQVPPQSSASTTIRKRSQIAPDTAATTVDSALPPDIKGGFDVIILLDVQNEQLFKRFTGRREDSLTGEQYHVELNPPPISSLGLHERLVVEEDSSGQARQLQYFVSTFEDNEESVKEWYQRFKNIKIIDANGTPEDTWERVQVIIQKLLETKQAEKEALDLAQNKVAEVLAESNTSEVRTSNSAGQGKQQSATAQLFASVNAELLAQAEDTTESVKLQEKKGRTSSSGKSRVGSAAGRKSQPNIANKKEGSRQGSAKSAGPAEPAATGTILSSAQAPVQPTSFSGSVSTTLAGPVVPAGASVATGAVTVASTAIAAAAAAATASAAEHLSALKENINSSKKQNKGPSKELIYLLTDQWTSTEASYTNTIKYIFRSLRRERQETIGYFHETKTHFREFLARPDKKQRLLASFQRAYNEVDDDLRCDADAKAELHQRAEDLRELLWEIADKRKDEAEYERITIIDDRFVEDHFIILMNLYIGMVQSELDRFAGSKQLLLDYTKESMGGVIEENVNNLVATPKLSFVTQLPDNLLNISSSLTSTRRDHATTAITSGTTASSKKPLPGASTISVKRPTLPAQSISNMGVVPARNEENAEQIMFAAFHTAFDTAVNFIARQEESEKKDMWQRDRTADKKKSSASDTNADSRDSEADQLPEWVQALKLEEQLTKCRLERIKHFAVEHLKGFKDKALEVYTQIDDWVGRRYKSEMDAIRDLTHLIKDAVELETKLPNQLVLQGDMFHINYNTLTFKPPTVQPQDNRGDRPDQFSLNHTALLLHHLRQCAPKGDLTIKLFIDLMQRIALSSNNYELLPEVLLTGDYRQLQHLAVTLDAVNSGSINWKKFALLTIGVLPIPDLDHLLDMKRSFVSLNSYVDGKATLNDIMLLPLWFKTQPQPGETPGAHARRVMKIKTILFEIFAAPPPVTTNEQEIQKKTKSASNLASGTIGSGELVTSNNLPSNSNLDASATHSNGTSTLHRDNEWVNVDEMLLFCCMNEDGRKGLNNAFVLKSQTDDGNVSFDQLYEILHFCVPPAAQNSRFSDNIASDPFSENMLSLILFGMVDNSTEMTVSFDTFVASIERQQQQAVLSKTGAIISVGIIETSDKQIVLPFTLAMKLFKIGNIRFIESKNV